MEEYDRDYHQGAFVDIFTMDYAGEDFDAFMKLHKRTSMLASLKMRIDFHQLSGIKRYLRIGLQLIFKLVPIRTLFNYLQKQTHLVINNDVHNSTMGVSGIEFAEKELFPLEDLYPLQLHQFEDAQFYIPNNYDKLLKDYFGDYMWIPPVEERIPHGIFYSLKRFYDLPNKK
ncbi:MAG: LicD family protein [Erysipelotrichaceae bacterium]